MTSPLTASCIVFVGPFFEGCLSESWLGTPPQSQKLPRGVRKPVGWKKKSLVIPPWRIRQVAKLARLDVLLFTETFQANRSFYTTEQSNSSSYLLFTLQVVSDVYIDAGHLLTVDQLLSLHRRSSHVTLTTITVLQIFLYSSSTVYLTLSSSSCILRFPYQRKMDRATSLPPPSTRGLLPPISFLANEDTSSSDLLADDSADLRWPGHAVDTSAYFSDLQRNDSAKRGDGREMYAQMAKESMHAYTHGHPQPVYSTQYTEPMYTHASALSTSNDALTVDPRHFFGEEAPQASHLPPIQTRFPVNTTDALAASTEQQRQYPGGKLTSQMEAALQQQTPFILPPAYTAHLPPAMAEIATSASSAPTSRATSPSRKRGGRFDSAEITLLRQAFAQNPQPNHEQYLVIAQRLGVPLKKVHTWFQCQRAKYRKANTPYPVPIQIFFPTMQRVQVDKFDGNVDISKNDAYQEESQNLPIQ